MSPVPRRIARSRLHHSHPGPRRHDRFSADLIERVSWTSARRPRHFPRNSDGLGREKTGNQQETFCMTVLGLRLSRVPMRFRLCTAKSHAPCGTGLCPGSPKTKFHRTLTTAFTFHPGWPRKISGSTTGHLAPTGTSTAATPKFGRALRTSTTGELLGDTSQPKSKLLEFVRRRAVEQAERRFESREVLSRLGKVLSPDALTIGFARRFATYKRAPDPRRSRKPRPLW